VTAHQPGSVFINGFRIAYHQGIRHAVVTAGKQFSLTAK